MSTITTAWDGPETGPASFMRELLPPGRSLAAEAIPTAHA